MKLEWNEMVQRLTNKEEAMKEARQHERRQEERIIERLKAERDEAEVKLKAASRPSSKWPARELAVHEVPFL